MKSHIPTSPNQVRRTMLLGRLEENVLYAAMACGRGSTAKAIYNRIRSKIGDRSVSYIHTTLDRLADKGLMEKTLDETPDAGKRPLYSYSVTEDGEFNIAFSFDMVRQLAQEAGLSAHASETRRSA